VVVSDPGGVIDPPVDHVQLTFNHPIDPTSLTTAQLGFTGPAGNIALTGVTAVSSTNNQQFDVSFASQTQLGDYALVVGAAVRDSHGTPLGSPFTDRFVLFGLSGSVLTVNSTADTASDSDPWLTLREAISIVNSPSLPTDLSPEILAQISGTLHAHGSDAIVFDPASVTGPITLSGSQLELSLSQGTARVTIDGGPAGVTVDGNNASRVLQVDAGVQATLAHLTITHGRRTTYPDLSGGGISNQGTLTVTGGTLLANSAGVGGGIFNAGTLTVTSSTFSGNSTDLANGGGAGVFNTGMLAVTNCTFSANSATFGYGGGIYVNSGTATVTGSTLESNSAYNGGGIANYFGGTLTVPNCTVSSNSAAAAGGGIYNDQDSTLTVLNCTIDANSAAAAGGGIYNDPTSTLGLENTIVAGNRGDTESGPDINGRVQSSSHNLVGRADRSLSGLSNGPGGNLVGSSLLPVDPRLGPLADNGGPTLTQALLPDSPARGAGSLDFASPTDQRGLPRVVGDEIDLGSFETQTDVAGPQVVFSNPTGYVDPPVDHVRVTFNHPIDLTSLTADQFSLTGPGGDIAVTGVAVVPSTDDQQIDVSFAAQTDPGDYALVVGADVRDSHGTAQGTPFTARFSLFGLPGSTLTVNSTLDTANDSDPYLSLREAIAIVNSPTLPTDLSPQILAQISGTLHANHSDAIVFDPASVTGPITLGGGALELGLASGTARVTIDGGDAGVTVDGNNLSRVFQVDVGVQATFAHLTITHGRATGSGMVGLGGGIYNGGTLAVTNCTLRANSANFGGGVGNEGPLTVTDSTLEANSAFTGAGIYNDVALTVTSSTLDANTAGSFGGGIYNASVLSGAATLTVTDSTFSANSAGLGGGIDNASGTVTVSNSTFSRNSAYDGGGIYNNSGSTTDLQNTIVAGNHCDHLGPDFNGSVQSSSAYNLIGIADSTFSGTGDGSQGNQIGTPANPIDPRLAPLGNYGGPTQTMPLLPGSPALNAGDPGQLGTPDQRGLPRSGGVNIGAFQASASTVVLTAPTNAQAGVPFDLVVAVYDAFGQSAVGYSGTLHFDSTDPDPNVVLPPDYTFGASDGGMVTFSAESPCSARAIRR
jgi:hypothetical protein